MLNLSNVTLLCVETRVPELAHWAIDQCLRGTRFAKVVLLTNIDLIENKRSDIEYVQAPAMRSTEDYSDLILTGISQHVTGSHVLIIQWDSFITHPNLWQNKFLDYDYIGPVWPHHPETPVGNGGFSLRSVKLLHAIQQPKFIKKHPEDYCICCDNRAFLEKECGIQFAPTEIAEQFAVERSEWHEAFGFHGFFNFDKVLTEKKLDEFFNLIPAKYLKGIDAYELCSSLRAKHQNALAQLLFKKIRFSWRMRKVYWGLKIWLILGYKV